MYIDSLQYRTRLCVIFLRIYMQLVIDSSIKTNRTMQRKVIPQGVKLHTHTHTHTHTHARARARVCV